MTVRPLIFLHGIRGSRLAEMGAEPEIVWQLADEHHPRVGRIALHGAGGDGAAGPPVAPLDLEPEVYGPFLQRFARRGPLIAPPWDWRLAPADALERIAGQLPTDTSFDVVTHSMGLHLLAESVLSGRLPQELLRRLVLVTPPFRGSLDIFHVLRSGCDRPPTDGGSGEDATGAFYGPLVRGFPALYRLLPVPGSGLVVDAEGREPDLLEPASWPADQAGVDGRHTRAFHELLAGARRDRERLRQFVDRLAGPLAERCLVLLASGVPTPSRLRLPLGDGEPELSFDVNGDGRLVPASSRPPRPGPIVETVGNPQHPVPHGDVMREEASLSRIEAWLDSE